MTGIICPDYLKTPDFIPVCSAYTVLGDELKFSNCLRRKYAAALLDTRFRLVKVTTNHAYGCKNGCDRIINEIPHGTRYEECSSIHAEQALFVESNHYPSTGYSMVLRCFDVQVQREIEAIPCKICARIIIHSGIEWIFTSEKRYNARELCFSILED